MLRLDVNDTLPEGYSPVYTYWTVQVDDDPSQRNGSFSPVGYWASESAAYQQAVGMGEAEIVKVMVCAAGGVPDNLAFAQQRVYGYCKSWTGQWGYSWLDGRDAPVDDPEYQEFMRLKQKFEGA